MAGHRRTRATDQTYSVDLDRSQERLKLIRICQVFPHHDATVEPPTVLRRLAVTQGLVTTPGLLNTNIAESISMAQWRPHRLPASSTHQKPVPGRRSPSETSNWLLPIGVASLSNQQRVCRRPSSLRQSPPRDGWLYFVRPTCMPEGSRSVSAASSPRWSDNRPRCGCCRPSWSHAPSSVDAALNPLDFLATSPTRRPRKKRPRHHSLV